jgi:hypothetical protein
MSSDNLIDKLIAWPGALINKLKPSEDIAARVNRYSDLEGLSTKQLNVGLWYKQQTKLFFLVIVWALVVVASVLWSYSLYFLGDYLFVGLKQERENLSVLSESINVVHYDFDSGLAIGRAQALPLGNNHYDLIGTLANKNAQVRGLFNYYFLVDGRKFGGGSAFVFPQEERLVISINTQIDFTPTTVELVLDNFNWQRINLHDIPDWPAFKTSHLDFAIRDKVFTSAGESGLSDNLDINQLSFNLVNQTPFNYRQAPFVVILSSQGQIASVNRYVVLDFKPKQQEEVTLNIIGKLPPIDNIEVIPDIDILDKENFGPIQ